MGGRWVEGQTEPYEAHITDTHSFHKAAECVTNMSPLSPLWTDAGPEVGCTGLDIKHPSDT